MVEPEFSRAECGRGIAVLVVDDVPLNRIVITTMLRGMAFDIYEAGSGFEALEIIDFVRIDIILLDIMMPGMDGFATLREIRKRPSYADTPIVVVSAREDTESFVTAIEAGADDYLTKPLRIQILAAKLRRLANAARTSHQRADLKARNEAMGDAVPDALIIINERGLITWANRATEAIFGYSRELLLAQNVSMLMPEPDHSKHDRYLERYHRTGQGSVIGSRRRAFGQRADGRLFPLELTVQPLSLPAGRHYLGMVRDMTEAEQLERMKQDFISVINHELRTPLTSIVGSLSLLASGAAGELPAGATKMVSVAARNTQRLGRLINDILDLDKIDCGALSLNYSVQPALRLLEEAFSFNQDAARAAEVELRLDLERMTQREVFLRVDADRFQQVMSNLLSNAIKFSPADSEVCIAAISRPGALQIAVSDLGPGIPPEFHARIFQRFAQHARPDSRQREGSGLGLSITRALVTQMGGQIGFDTERRQGSLFHFTLPLADTESTQ